MAEPQQLDPARLCPVCRGGLNYYAPPPQHPGGCTAAHERGYRLDMLITLQQSIDSPSSARAYVRALHAQPLQPLLDLLRWHTDRMGATTLREWFARLRDDPQEAVDPTLCPAAQLWEALHQRLGSPNTLLLVTLPVLRASMGLVVHVAWPHGVPWLPESPGTQLDLVRLCSPRERQMPWDTALDAMPAQALAHPWDVTCPDCVDLLPMLGAIKAVQLLVQVVA